MARPEVLMQLKHLIEEADLGHKHEHQYDQNPRIVPSHLIMRERFGNVHDFEAKCEVRGLRKQAWLLHFHLQISRFAVSTKFVQRQMGV